MLGSAQIIWICGLGSIKDIREFSLFVTPMSPHFLGESGVKLNTPAN